MRSLQTDLIGSWRMLSWTYQVLETGEVFNALGERPRGFINYSPDGRMMVLVTKRDRSAPAGLVPTDVEKAALYDTMFAYAGTYEVDAESVVHSIDLSWNERWTGTQQVRRAQLVGDKLTYVSQPATNPLDGRECVHTVQFERVLTQGRA